ncbi:1752_t:CDS:2 [Paraglomus brasilianum]|uniref:1752_t:CDS:1 n=1 Tax=Paraglomus brasilianum TaxID=144538 RepID=A0A9N9B1L6_9GLOM|nr:1752_t:CDS:2 [Paraglomus brasilianum]
MKAVAVVACSVLILAAAQSAEAALPTFTYSLTQKSLGDRTQICQLNMGFCSTNCGGPDKAPKNFCNVTTMGWGCGCSTKVPDFQGWQWPLNQQDCFGRGEPAPPPMRHASMTVPQPTLPSTCATDQQPPAYYNVDNVDDIPTYGPPSPNSNSSSNGTASGGSSSGNSSTTGGSKSSSSTNYAYSLGSMLSALVVAGGMMIL